MSGGAYWFQNTRHSYWPRLADGDFDTMEEWFKMFTENLPLAEARSKLWFGHRGAWHHEMMWNFGAMPSDVYGCDRSNRPVGWIQCTYHRYYYTNALELARLALERYMHTLDQKFLEKVTLPLTVGALRFFFEHYGPTAAGKPPSASITSA